MEFAMAMRAVPPLVVNVGESETTEDAGDCREGVTNAANSVSPAAVVCARHPKMKVARFLNLCGTSTGQRGRSILWLVSSMGKPRVLGAQRGAPIRPGSPLRLGRGVCRRARQKKGLCAGVVAAFQLAGARPMKWLRPKTKPMNFHGAKVLAGLILAGSPANVRQGFKLQTSGNAKIWPETPATNSTISAIAWQQVNTGASLSRNAMCSRFFRLGKCTRLHEHIML